MSGPLYARLQPVASNLDAAARRKLAGFDVPSEDVSLGLCVQLIGTKIAYASARRRRINAGLGALAQLEGGAEKYAGVVDKAKGFLSRLRGEVPGTLKHTPEAIPNVFHPNDPVGAMQRHTVTPTASGNKPVLLEYGGKPHALEGNTMAIENGALPIPDYARNVKEQPLAVPDFVSGKSPVPVNEAGGAAATKTRTPVQSVDLNAELPLLHQLQGSETLGRRMGAAGGALVGAGVGAAGAGEGHRLEGAAGGAALGGLGGAIAAPRALARATSAGRAAETGGTLQSLSEKALGLREGGGGKETQALLAGGLGLGAATAGAGALGGGIAGYGVRPLDPNA